jgi:5-hydroxyisourate hydrolase-like protein (transthyretin family)
MMVLRSGFFVLLSSVVLLLAGCGSGADFSDADLDEMAGGQRKETVPVSGAVTVGGEPAAKVQIKAYTKESGMEPAAQGETRADGTYCLSTYKECDGIQPGSYRLAFTQVEKAGKGKKSGEDLFQGKYRNPMQNDFPLEVQSGAPQVDVNFDLE